jgi:hypothetical protein
MSSVDYQTWISALTGAFELAANNWGNYYQLTLDAGAEDMKRKSTYAALQERAIGKELEQMNVIESFGERLIRCSTMKNESHVSDGDLSDGLEGNYGVVQGVRACESPIFDSRPYED